MKKISLFKFYFYFNLRLKTSLRNTSPLRVSDVNVVITDEALVFLLIAAGNRITPVRVADVVGVTAFHIFAHGEGEVLPDEEEGDAVKEGGPGGVLGEELGGEGNLAIALPAGVGEDGGGTAEHVLKRTGISLF